MHLWTALKVPETFSLITCLLFSSSHSLPSTGTQASLQAPCALSCQLDHRKSQSAVWSKSFIHQSNNSLALAHFIFFGTKPTGGVKLQQPENIIT